MRILLTIRLCLVISAIVYLVYHRGRQRVILVCLGCIGRHLVGNRLVMAAHRAELVFFLGVGGDCVSVLEVERALPDLDGLPVSRRGSLWLMMAIQGSDQAIYQPGFLIFQTVKY